MKNLSLLPLAVLMLSMTHHRQVGNFYESSGKSYFNGDVNIFEIKGDYTGHSIWLSRKGQRVKAKYFAYKLNGKSVSERFNEWKTGRKIVSVCSGAFTATDWNTPHGIIIDDGKLVNRQVDDKMDGLVVVEAVGGMRITDLDNGNLWLQSLNRRVNVRNSADKNVLIDWAAQEVATVFQTQMMYFDNTDKMGHQNEQRERRILVIGKLNNEVTYILFNLPKDVSLTQASRDLFNYLRNSKNLNVIGMLNLDTGGKDIIEVFDDYGNKLSHIKPKNQDVKFSDASNLLAFYYE